MTLLKATRKARRYSYIAQLLLGDAVALQNHRVKQRIYNRVIGRLAGKAMRSLWK